MNESPVSLRDRQRSQTRSEIIRAAFDLFGKLGFEDVSVDMIAAAVGISRATFFNYFPKKELVLREIAAARLAKLQRLLEELISRGETPTLHGLLEIICQICEENVRLSGRSRKVLLELFLRNISPGMILENRQRAMDVLAGVMERIPSNGKYPSRLIAETLFGVYLATMLEWMFREDLSSDWLPAAMRQRGQLVLEGLE